MSTRQTAPALRERHSQKQPQAAFPCRRVLLKLELLRQYRKGWFTSFVAIRCFRFINLSEIFVKLLGKGCRIIKVSNILSCIQQFSHVMLHWICICIYRNFVIIISRQWSPSYESSIHNRSGKRKKAIRNKNKRMIHSRNISSFSSTNPVKPVLSEISYLVLSSIEWISVSQVSLTTQSITCIETTMLKGQFLFFATVCTKTGYTILLHINMNILM